MRSHKHSLLVFVTLATLTVTGCGEMDPQGRSSRHAFLSSRTVRVATWNVEAVGAPGTTEYNAALSVLNRIGADVVGINEVSSTADVQYFQDLAADAGYDYQLVPSSNPYGSLRCAILSRFPFLETGIHTSADLSGDSSANDITRYVVEALIDVPDTDQDLTAVVQHWKSGTGNDDEFRRVVESNRVAQAVADLDSASDAFVIMGDFNEEFDSVPRSPAFFTSEPGGLPSTYSLGVDLEAEMTSVGLYNDPFDYLLRVDGPEAAVLDALQLDGTDSTRPASGRRLDYLLVSQALMAESPPSEVYDSSDEGLPGGLPKYGSPLSSSTSLDAADHLLVFTDLTLSGGSIGCTSDTECDDGNFCNGQETCVASVCQAGVPVDCDNGVFCDGAEVCDPTLGCQAGPAPDCASDQCNLGVCDVVADACVFEPLPDDTFCDNGDACTGDMCRLGVCQPAICGPDAPQNLLVESGRNVQLSWDPVQIPNLLRYQVYRRDEAAGPWVFLAEVSRKKNSYSDRRPGNGFFCYVVTAVDRNQQESPHSNEACGSGSPNNKPK